MIVRSSCYTIMLPVIAGAVAPSACGDQPSADLRAEFEQATADFELAQQTQADDPQRARRLFCLAAQRFESVISTGIVNGRLEYNLGNCHLQAGDVGQAILHYRRAQRLIPRDPWLADNLADARTRSFTTIPPPAGSALLKSVFFWHHETSHTGRCRAALALYVTVWVLLAARNFFPNRSTGVAAIVCGALTLTLVGSVAHDRWSDRHAPQGVVIDMDVVVYKGPGTGYPRQFERPLPPGVEFTLRKRRGPWWNVEFADGQTGWIQAAATELIPAQRCLLPTVSSERQGAVVVLASNGVYR